MAPLSHFCGVTHGFPLLSPWCLGFPQHRPVLNHCHTSDGTIWVRKDWRDIPSCLHSCFGQGLSTHRCCQGIFLIITSLARPVLNSLQFFFVCFNRR